MANKQDALKVLKSDMIRKLKTLDKSFVVRRESFHKLMEIEKKEIKSSVKAAMILAGSKAVDKLIVGPEWDPTVTFYDSKKEKRSYTDTSRTYDLNTGRSYQHYESYSINTCDDYIYNTRSQIRMDMAKHSTLNEYLQDNYLLYKEAGKKREALIEKYEDITRDVNLYGLDPDLISAISEFNKMPDKV